MHDMSTRIIIIQRKCIYPGGHHPDPSTGRPMFWGWAVAMNFQLFGVVREMLTGTRARMNTAHGRGKEILLIGYISKDNVSLAIVSRFIVE